MRGPKVGEVWTHKRIHRTFEVKFTEGDQIGGLYRVTDDVGRFDPTAMGYCLAHFLSEFDPPPEPWENPQGIDAWAPIQEDGRLAPVVIAHAEQAYGLYGWRPPFRIVKVKLVPVRGTAQLVERTVSQ